MTAPAERTLTAEDLEGLRAALVAFRQYIDRPEALDGDPGTAPRLWDLVVKHAEPLLALASSAIAGQDEIAGLRGEVARWKARDSGGYAPDGKTWKEALFSEAERRGAAEARVTALTAERDGLREALTKPFAVVFLDGRNEHGSHVLTCYPTNIPEEQLQRDLNECAEEVLSKAEALGFAVGDAIWTVWTWNEPQYGNEGRVEFAGYWELQSIDVEMSKMLKKDPTNAR